MFRSLDLKITLKTHMKHENNPSGTDVYKLFENDLCVSASVNISVICSLPGLPKTCNCTFDKAFFKGTLAQYSVYLQQKDNTIHLINIFKTL